MTESERFLELNARVVAWAEEKGILAAGDELAQLGKTLEECREFLEAVRSGDVEQIKLEMGDVLVTVCVRMAMEKVEWMPSHLRYISDIPHVYRLRNLREFTGAACNLDAHGLADAHDIAAHYGFTVCDALQAAVEKIEKRTGKMVDGVFVKEGE